MMQSPQTIVRPLFILNSLSAVFCIGLVVAMIARGYAGFGQTYSSTSVCNTYLLKKYETQKGIGYEAHFLSAIIALICLAIQCILNIRNFMQIRDLQQTKSPQIFKWSQKEFILKYLFQSIAILFLLPVFIFYLSILIEQGGCLNLVYVDWLIFLIGSFLSLAFSIICWIILFKYFLSLPAEEQLKHETNIGHNELRQKESEMRNIFEMEGALDMYKTNKLQNKESIEPLLVQNPPIPLFLANSNKNLRKLSKINQEYEQMQAYPSPKMNRSVSINPAYAVPTQNDRKKSSPERFAAPMKKSRQSIMIEKKKEKFREINPFKVGKSPKHKNDETNYDDEVYYENLENKMNNLPKGYIQYIRESKKPKRITPDIFLLMQAINQQQKALAEEPAEKPFLKKYRIQLDEESHKSDGQIEFIDQNENKVETYKQPKVGAKAKDEGELFYHKPKIDKNPKKKRKALFEEEVGANNFLAEQNQEKDVIINKLKEAKINHKSKLNAKGQAQHDGSKSPKRKNVKTKQDIMVNFLKSKFNTNESNSPQKQTPK